MSKDAHLQLEAAIRQIQTIQANPNLKVFFFDVDGLLLNTRDDTIINEQQLYFTLYHLHKEGHLLCIATGIIPGQDPQRTAMLERCLERIHQNTGVQFFVDEACFNTAHLDDDLIAKEFDGDAEDAHLFGKNHTIRLVLRKLKHRLASDTQSKQPAINNDHVVLVDDDPQSVGHAKRLGMQGIQAETISAKEKYRTEKTNNLYLSECLGYTKIAAQSRRWLAGETLGPNDTRHAMYFALQFEQYRVEENKRTAFRKAVLARMTPKPKHALTKQVLMTLLCGCVATCVGGIMIASGVGVPFGIAITGISLHLILAKLGILFGIGGVAGGMLTAIWRKACLYRRFLRNRKEIKALDNFELQVKEILQPTMAMVKGPGNGPMLDPIAAAQTQMIKKN